MVAGQRPGRSSTARRRDRHPVACCAVGARDRRQQGHRLRHRREAGGDGANVVLVAQGRRPRGGARRLAKVPARTSSSSCDRRHRRPRRDRRALRVGARRAPRAERPRRERRQRRGGPVPRADDRGVGRARSPSTSPARSCACRTRPGSWSACPRARTGRSSWSRRSAPSASGPGSRLRVDEGGREPARPDGGLRAGAQRDPGQRRVAGITVTPLVAARLVDEPRHPRRAHRDRADGSAGEPDDMGAAALFLCQPASRFVTGTNMSSTAASTSAEGGVLRESSRVTYPGCRERVGKPCRVDAGRARPCEQDGAEHRLKSRRPPVPFVGHDGGQSSRPQQVGDAAANMTSINAQQQPRQNSPWCCPMRKACDFRVGSAEAGRRPETVEATVLDRRELEGAGEGKGGAAHEPWLPAQWCVRWTTRRDPRARA